MTCTRLDDCKLKVISQQSTCVYYPPVYNSEGVNTNPDRNTTTTVYECLTCGERITKEK